MPSVDNKSLPNNEVERLLRGGGTFIDDTENDSVVDKNLDGTPLIPGNQPSDANELQSKTGIPNLGDQDNTPTNPAAPEITGIAYNAGTRLLTISGSGFDDLSFLDPTVVIVNVPGLLTSESRVFEIDSKSTGVVNDTTIEVSNFVPLKAGSLHIFTVRAASMKSNPFKLVV